MQLDIPFPEFRDKQLKLPFREYIAEDIKEILLKDPERLHFILHTHSDLVDVLIDDTSTYQVDRKTYLELTK